MIEEKEAIKRLEVEIKLLNEVLEECRYTLNNKSNSQIMNMRLKKQIAKVNLESKIRGYDRKE